ncbi:MAG: PqqD family protein of HPr-rel-A system [Ilumatobacter sp.]|jgi:PqqD family protein of HPr-rel-A system
MMAAQLPDRNPDTLVASFDGAYVVFDPRCSEVHLIDSLSAVIFDACDGTSLSDLVADITEIFGIDVAQAEQAIESNLDEFARKGLLAGTYGATRPP